MSCQITITDGCADRVQCCIIGKVYQVELVIVLNCIIVAVCPGKVYRFEHILCIVLHVMLHVHEKNLDSKNVHKAKPEIAGIHSKDDNESKANVLNVHPNHLMNLCHQK
jgi:hypothetical protein